MEKPFAFDPLLAFSMIGIFLVLGVFLRARVKFFQSFLIPSCIIGGIVGCIFLNFKLVDLPFSLFENIAYHCLNIAFISVGLTRNEQHKAPGKGRRVLKGALWIALMKGVTWPMQAIIGLAFVILFGLVGQELFPTFGLFLPLGFNEGPGQSLALGKVYESFGFQHASTVGLTFALIGYLFCFFVGIPMIRAGLKKGSARYGKKTLTKDFQKGILPRDNQIAGSARQTLYPENIDNMAYQMALVGFVFIVTYLFFYGLMQVLPAEQQKVVWGFYFAFGLIFATITSRVMKKIGVDHLVDPGTQRRITGFSLDFMIGSTLMAIQLAVVWEFIIPIMVISLTGGCMTLLSILYFGKRLEDHNLERTIVAYGTYTGQLSTGLLLLRTVDPDFKSPVLFELVVLSFIAVPIVLSCMLLATIQLTTDVGIGLTMALYGVIMALSAVLLKILRLWGKPKELF